MKTLLHSIHLLLFKEPAATNPGGQCAVPVLTGLSELDLLSDYRDRCLNFTVESERLPLEPRSSETDCQREGW